MIRIRNYLRTKQNYIPLIFFILSLVYWIWVPIVINDQTDNSATTTKGYYSWRSKQHNKGQIDYQLLFYSLLPIPFTIAYQFWWCYSYIQNQSISSWIVAVCHGMCVFNYMGGILLNNTIGKKKLGGSYYIKERGCFSVYLGLFLVICMGTVSYYYYRYFCNKNGGYYYNHENALPIMRYSKITRIRINNILIFKEPVLMIQQHQKQNNTNSATTKNKIRSNNNNSHNKDQQVEV